MNSKTLLGGVIAGVIYFLLGWLIWGFLMKDTMAAMMNCMRPETEMNMVLGIVSSLLWGYFYALVLSKWGGVNSLSSGLQAGAVFTFALCLALDVGFFTYSTIFNSWSGVALDVAINTVVGAILGGVIGWWYGRK